MARKATRIIVASVLISVALWFTPFDLLWNKVHHNDPPPAPTPVEVPRYEAWGIRDLKSSIQISSINIKPESAEYKPPLRQDIDLSLRLTEIDITQPISPDLPVDKITVQIAKPEIPDASSLLIGLATTLGRLQDALPAFAIWASKTNARFIVIIGPQKENEPSASDITQLYKDNDILLTLITSDLEWYDQYVSLLGALYDHKTPSTKWTCIMDDDTFFFSLRRVLTMLSTHDSAQPLYIGGLSENKDTMDRLGYLAYGGAGVFFSIPLLSQLRPHIDECIALPDPAGDIRVSTCIYTFTETKFTWSHHLFQMDLHGDVTGFYEAIRTLPLSTHHWKTWHHHDMVQTGAIAQICGNDCILQKYRFGSGHIMTNGFSIIKYSYTAEEEAKHVDVAMEHTWADTAWVIPTSWSYTLAPLKPKDEGKIQYLLEKVENETDGMRLYYVHRKHGLGEGIIQVFWERLS